MLLNITSTGDRLFGFINIDDLEPLKKRFLVNFSQFLDAAYISTLNCDEMAGDRPSQDRPADKCAPLKPSGGFRCRLAGPLAAHTWEDLAVEPAARTCSCKSLLPPDEYEQEVRWTCNSNSTFHKITFLFTHGSDGSIVFSIVVEFFPSRHGDSLTTALI